MNIPLLAALIALLTSAGSFAQSALPDGFVYVEDIVPGVVIDLRYYSETNFVGHRIDGYLKPKCILTRQAANALAKVQADLEKMGLGLKVFDAYRPQRAVDHFARWARDQEDRRMKATYYPDVHKSELFDQGYIANKSGHSRGSTVDLTLVVLRSKSEPREIDMGSPFDFFGRKSWVVSQDISKEQRDHRLLLKSVMERHGFEGYAQEWWHFTLVDEPFPAKYFDFPVK